MHDRPPPFADLAVTAPDGLEAVVHRALEKSREQRFGSIAELASALAPFAPRHLGAVSVARSSRVTAATAAGVGEWSAHGVGSPPGSSTAFSATTPSQPSTTPVPWTQHPAGRSSRARVGAALAAVVLLGVTFFVFYRLSAGNRASEHESPMQPAAATPGQLRPAAEREAPAEPLAGSAPASPTVSTEAPQAASERAVAPALTAGAAPADGQAGPAAGAPAGPTSAPAALPRARRPRPDGAAVKPPPGEHAAPQSQPQPPRNLSDFGGRR
jgi:hypothetical protein